MPTLNDLPPELIGNIASYLDPSTLLALRHTSKQLVVNNTYPFMNGFSTITVTCSKAGLARLAKMTDFEDSDSTSEDSTERAVCEKVEHVVLHVLTGYWLVEMAKDFDANVDKHLPAKRAYAHGRNIVRGVLGKLSKADSPKQESPYLLAYASMRQTLISSLNKLPDLKTITVTNEPAI